MSERLAGEILLEHRAWLMYFDVDVLVYCRDWEILGNELWFRDSAGVLFQGVRIDSVTPLPDELVFLRGVYLPSDEDDDEETLETYYGIASRWQIPAEWRVGDATPATRCEGAPLTD